MALETVGEQKQLIDKNLDVREEGSIIDEPAGAELHNLHLLD